MLNEYFNEEEIEELKKKDNLIEKSLDLVLRLFDDKTDKEGIPYIVHLMKVYSGVSSYNEKVVALLHDVIEDTEVTLDDLRSLGYRDDVIIPLSYLTKKKGEYYPDYIERIISSRDIHVYNVKLSDLKHNMDIKRIKNPTVNDYDRVTKRYMPAYEKILNAIENLKGEEKNVRY